MTIDTSLAVDATWFTEDRMASGPCTVRTFYSKAPERAWGLPRKVMTVVCAATLSWGMVFGFAALIVRL